MSMKSRFVIMMLCAILAGWICFIAMLAWWNFLLDGRPGFSVLFGLTSYFAGEQFRSVIIAASRVYALIDKG